ncbi:MAG: Scr1 family TA system antitoxin-like transcriptional regulator [Pseudonocardia sp.]
MTGPDPLRFHTVLTEAALRLEVGGPVVMTAQLERLLAVAGAEKRHDSGAAVDPGSACRDRQQLHRAALRRPRR